MRVRIFASCILAGGVALGCVVARGRVSHVATAVPERWSDPATWGGALPRSGDVVRIPAGREIVLDTNPPPLAQIVVDGTLRVADRRDVLVRTGGIAVTGTMIAGSPERPFTHRLAIVLSSGSAADRRAVVPMTMPMPNNLAGDVHADGAIAIHDGGRVDLIAPRRRAWTKLAASAPAGTRVLAVTDAVDWRRGDRVAIAPSGFDAREAEERTIASVTSATVTLTAPLRYRHFGETVDGVDERAEVALLSHDVVVRSDAASVAASRGGHVMVMRGGTLHVQGVQFTELGQRGRLGRYPIHFHLAGDARGSYVRASSVEHSFNRCITIHGTSNVELSDDVGFDTIGHCYFLEDGNERHNTLVRDLAMLVRVPEPAHRLLGSDVRPAGFWISNPDNIVSDDVSAGSLGGGFWYDLPEHPTGPSADKKVWPRRLALGEFARNVAHSNERDGLFVDVLRNPPGVTAAPNYAPPRVADFSTFTSYKNRRRGAWLRGVHLRVTDARIADNSIGVTFAGADAILQHSIIAGQTSNETGPPKPDDASFPIRGFEFYDGRVGVESTHFADFTPNAGRPASALSALQFSPFYTDPGNFARDLSFDRATPVYFATIDVPAPPELGADGYRATVFRDLDGSVAAALGATAAPAKAISITLDVPFLTGASCTHRPDWHVAICDGDYAALFVNDADPIPDASGPVTVAAEPEAQQPDMLRGIVLRGNPTDRIATGFQTNVHTGTRYRIVFGGKVPKHFKLSLHAVGRAEGVRVDVPQAGIAALDLHGGELVNL